MSPISVHKLRFGTLLGPEKTTVWLGSLVAAWPDGLMHPLVGVVVVDGVGCVVVC